VTGVGIRIGRATAFLQCSGLALSLAGSMLVTGCSVHPSTPPPTPPRPTLRELVPNTATIGSAGKLILRGTNFVPGASQLASPALSFRNIRVNSPEQITADYSSSPDSPLGYFSVTVATPSGTSERATFTITPLAYQFGVGVPPVRSAVVSFRSLQVGLHADPVANPDGSQTDAYLHVSFTDRKGHPVAVSGSPYSDMDNVDAPDDDSDESGATHPEVTSYSFCAEKPVAGEYVLGIKGSRKGSFVLEISDETFSEKDGVLQNGLSELANVPTFPGSSFELRFVCRQDPYGMDIDAGGLQPVHGAFSFAQPLTPNVQLPAGEKALAVVIYYDPVMEASSFRALLDGDDRTGMFRVRLGELQLVSIPLEAGQHTLTIRANNKSGESTEQEFRIQH